MRSLENADGERLTTNQSPTNLCDRLLDKADADDIMRESAEAGALFAGCEADGVSEKLIMWFRQQVDKPLDDGWASLVNHIEYDIDNMNREVFNGVIRQAFAFAQENDTHPGIFGGMCINEIAERLSRHMAEKAVEEYYDDVEMAELELESENVDLTCDLGKVQVYSGSSSKYWYNKSNVCNGSPDDREKAVEETNFDVFVFVRITDDGEFVAASREIADAEANSAASQTT